MLQKNLIAVSLLNLLILTGEFLVLPQSFSALQVARYF